MRAALAVSLLTLNTLFWVPILLLLALVKFILVLQTARRMLDPWLIRVAERWISGNSAWMRLTQKLDWDVQGLEPLRRREIGRAHV